MWCSHAKRLCGWRFCWNERLLQITKTARAAEIQRVKNYNTHEMYWKRSWNCFYKNKKETSKRFIVAELMTYFLSVFCILRVQLIIDVKNYVARQDVLTCSSNYRGFFPRRSLCFKLCFRSTFPRKKKLAFVMNKVIIHV